LTSAENGKPHVSEEMWFKSIPPAQRLSRQEMIAVADGYFTGLQKNDGKGINGAGTYPFTNDCSRMENGQLTASAPARTNMAPGQIDAFAMDCMTQFKLGYYFVVQKHSRSPLPACRSGTRRRLGARRDRSGDGQFRRPL